MASSPQPQPQPARATVTQKVATPDFVLAARKADETILNSVEKNPIYQCIFQGNATKEERSDRVVAYLTAGLADGTAKPEDLDKRRQELAELNASIQVIRKQLGSEQAKEITSKAYADFQRIVNETSADVDRFQDELAPLCDLAELFSKYGVDGNLIENIHRAKQQKRERDTRIAQWWDNHEVEVLAYRRSVSDLESQIQENQRKLERAWFGGTALQAQITNSQNDLAERRRQLTEAEAKQPPVEQATNGEIKTEVNEEILELQNIGGEKFKAAVATLRDHTEEALAKISNNFDEAVVGLTNARESFIAMDRNCGDATFALSILQFSVQQAETQSREIAQGLIANANTNTGKMAELDRMEREQRSEQLLSYTSALTTFLTDIGVAVASLRSGKTVIQTILRMNGMALEQANTHKITGIANTADAVTITIGSIIEVCNRAASQALADGLTRMRGLAQQGSARLVGGTIESLEQQNRQLAGFVESVTDLREMSHQISANTVDLLKQQFKLVADMAKASSDLSDANTESQRTAFDARAGVSTKADEPAPPPAERQGFRMRIGQPHE